MDKSEMWNFAVVGCDSKDLPHYVGLVKTYEEALKLKKSARVIGWQRLAIFDASLKEVKGDRNPLRPLVAEFLAGCFLVITPGECPAGQKLEKVADKNILLNLIIGPR